MLSIKNLVVEQDGKKLLDGLNLELVPGSVSFLMGPNGAGKSTLAQVIAGKKYSLITGEIKLDKKNLLNLEPFEISELGVFLSFQNPVEISGLSLVSFLRDAVKKQLERQKKEFSASQFLLEIKENLLKLELPEDFYKRDLNYGLSGGEKKKSEVLQILTLKPSLIILDEIDSGLDVDSLKIVLKVLKDYQKKSAASLIFITHQTKLLNLIQPNQVFVLNCGKITETGDKKLALEIAEKGFKDFL